MAYFDKAFTHGQAIKIDGKIYHVWGSYKRRLEAVEDAGDAREYGLLARVIKRSNPTRWIVALRTAR